MAHFRSYLEIDNTLEGKLQKYIPGIKILTNEELYKIMANMQKYISERTRKELEKDNE